MPLERMLKNKLKRFWPIALFALIHIIVFMVLFEGAFAKDWEGDYSILVFFDYASRVFNGELPYQDFSIEYPPIALLVMTVPRLITADPLHYQIAFASQILIFDLIGLLILTDMAKRLGYSLWITLAISTIALVVSGPLITERFDLIPAILVLCALYSFSRGWNTASWITLGIATMIKTYPIVIVPLFALYLLKQKNYSSLVKGTLTFGFTLLVIIVPCLCLSPEGFYESYSYHAERGLQIESTYASVLLLGNTLGLTGGEIRFDHAAWHMDTSLADSLADASLPIMAIILTMVYAIYAMQKQVETERSAHSRLISYFLLAILAFMVTSKVLSPQYIIWIYPLIPLIAGQWRIVYWMLFILIGAITYYIYPDHYDELLVREPRLIYILTMRNILLIVLAFVLIEWKHLFKNKKDQVNEIA